MGTTLKDETTASDMPKTARILAGALAVGVVGVSAYWLSRAVMMALAPQSQWVAPLPVRAANVTQRTLPSLDAEFDAFHRALPALDDDPRDMGEDAPETTLNLTLKGHRAGPDGSAYIQTPDRSQRNYYVGEEVMAGVTLESVSRGFVVIERSGQLERLSARDDASVFGMSADGTGNGRATPTNTAFESSRPRRRTAQASTPPPPTRAPQNASPAPDSNPGQSTAPRTPKPPANSVEPQGNAPEGSAPQGERMGGQTGGAPGGGDLSRIVAGDLIQNVSLTPVREGGRTLGFRIGARNGADLSQFGLQNGDIVSKVNGQDLTKGRPDMTALFEQLQRRSTATLVIERDGALMTVRIGS